MKNSIKKNLKQINSLKKLSPIIEILPFFKDFISTIKNSNKTHKKIAHLNLLFAKNHKLQSEIKELILDYINNIKKNNLYKKPNKYKQIKIQKISKTRKIPKTPKTQKIAK